MKRKTTGSGASATVTRSEGVATIAQALRNVGGELETFAAEMLESLDGQLTKALEALAKDAETMSAASGCIARLREERDALHGERWQPSAANVLH